MKIARRWFITNSLLSLAVASVGAAFWTGFGSWDDHRIRLFVLEQFKELTDAEVESFALEYQALYPEGTQTEALLRDLRGGATLFPISSDGWRERYRHRILEDFQSNDTVRLKNWILSRTEASMLCLSWRLRRSA